MRISMSPKAALPLLLLALAGPASAASVAEQQLSAALAAKPDLQHGRTLYEACVRCHNSDGSGNNEVPAIAGQYQAAVLRQLADFHYGKRWDVRMEAIATSHNLATPQDMADVSAYVSTLPRFNGPERGDGQLLAQGRQLYQNECASCHGLGGQGDAEKAIPWLAGQHYTYLLREMSYAAENRRPSLADHRALLEPFTRPDYEGVADYLSGLTAPAARP
jgi:cytochrome c553